MSERLGGQTTRISIVLLAAVAAGATMWWLRDILTPLVLALFLMVLIDGFARELVQRIPGFPEKAALPVALIVSIVLFGGAVYLIVENTQAFVAQLLDYGPKLHATLSRLAAQFGFQPPPTIDQMIAQLNPSRFVAPIAQLLQNVVGYAVFVLIYLGFLLASRQGFGRKIVILFPTHERRENAALIFGRIRLSVERYIWVQTVTGLMIAAAAWGIMAAVGLNDALFWAFFIFIAAYIPMIGAGVSIIAPAVFALVQFDTVWQAIVLLVGIEAVFFVMGNVVLPKMQGASLNLDPVAVLLSLGFWGALWGLPGAFLSSPLTVVLMVILAQFPGSRWIAVLLSDKGDPDNFEETSAFHRHRAKPVPADGA